MALNINVLWYDENILNDENRQYILRMHQLVSGEFIPCAKKNCLTGVLSDLGKRAGTQQFIIITSGAASEIVLPAIKQKQKVVVSVVVFCFNLQKWGQLKGSNGVVAVVNTIDGLIDSLRAIASKTTFERLQDESPLVSIDIYPIRLQSLHRSIASCVKANYKNSLEFSTCMNRFKKIISELGVNGKDYATQEIESLLNKNPNDPTILKNIISQSYMGETDICYVVNKVLRQSIPKTVEDIKIYPGTLMFALRKSAELQSNLRLTENKILYRSVELDYIRLNQFYINVGQIICFPAFTSTSLSKSVIGNFPTQMASAVEKEQNNTTYFFITFNYNPSAWQLDPVQVHKIQNSSQYEQEVLFTAFSFFRIDKVEFGLGTAQQPNIVNMTYIPKSCDVEPFVASGRGLVYNSSTKLITPN